MLETVTPSPVTTLPVEDVLQRWRPGSRGDEWTWDQEFAELVREHSEHVACLLEDVAEQGIFEPVLLGDDGRLWDGHHRMLVARLRGMTEVPVEHARDPEAIVITVPAQTRHSPEPAGPPASIAEAITAVVEIGEAELAEVAEHSAPAWAGRIAEHAGHPLLGRYNVLTGWRHVWCSTCGVDLLNATTPVAS